VPRRFPPAWSIEESLEAFIVEGRILDFST
jgi:hypothetical protein